MANSRLTSSNRYQIAVSIFNIANLLEYDDDTGVARASNIIPIGYDESVKVNNIHKPTLSN